MILRPGKNHESFDDELYYQPIAQAMTLKNTAQIPPSDTLGSTQELKACKEAGLIYL